MPDSASSTIESLLAEKRHFPPSNAFRAQANANDPTLRERAAADPETFWAAFAKELTWSEPWEKVLDWQAPFAKWFVGGKLNASVNCVDRHADGARAMKRAIVWEGEPGESRTLTYADLKLEVSRFANALRNLGVEKGDRVAIYLPMTPELAISMLACARIGAIHSVVFAGFSSKALASRIQDSGAKVVITADGSYRRGKVLPLKEIVDGAVAECPDVEYVVVQTRTREKVAMQEGRDLTWEQALDGVADDCEPAEMDAEDPLFTLYTSGTTGKPKGVLHTTGGYMVGTYATTKLVFDLKEDDVYFCTADCGWITGHSYIVYGPLANGATVMMYEGAPDWPDKDRFWDMVARHKATIFYTAPTAIRAFMKWGDEYPARHDLSSLRLLGTVGEPINPEAWMWYHLNIGKERCPIVDTWWQTETGMIMLTTLPGIDDARPGFTGKPFPGVEMDIVDEAGVPVANAHEGGYLIINKPWPAMFRTLWGDDERYKEVYWSRYTNPTRYFPADGAKREEGYYMVLGRVDDVMNVSGHRISTMEVESALVDHPSVAEAAVVGRKDEMKGQAIVAYVILRSGAPIPSEEDLRAHVSKELGAIARPDRVIITPDLPKTRSGKIMRRLLRDIAEGREIGDVTTLADPAVVEHMRKAAGPGA